MRSIILVDTMDPRITRDMLCRLFEPFGTVDGVDLVEGQSFGFVRMASEAAARHAIAALNGQSCSGIQLNMRAAHEMRDHEQRKNARQPEGLHGQ